MLKTVEIITESGYRYRTNVSAQSTQKSVNAYFLGTLINIEAYPSEKKSRVISCKLVK